MKGRSPVNRKEAIQACLLGLDAPPTPVRVRGNADAIADAVRNLVENAVFQSPAGAEVAVTVSEEGSVTVADRGPGVRPRVPTL